MSEQQAARDSGSGQYVSKEYAEENPATTQVETVDRLRADIRAILEDLDLSPEDRLEEIEALVRA